MRRWINAALLAVALVSCTNADEPGLRSATAADECADDVFAFPPALNTWDERGARVTLQMESLTPALLNTRDVHDLVQQEYGNVWNESTYTRLVDGLAHYTEAYSFAAIDENTDRVLAICILEREFVDGDALYLAHFSSARTLRHRGAGTWLLQWTLRHAQWRELRTSPDRRAERIHWHTRTSGGAEGYYRSLGATDLGKTPGLSGNRIVIATHFEMAIDSLVRALERRLAARNGGDPDLAL